MPEVTESARAWLAGFFDGEGAVVINPKIHAVYCHITNTDKGTLEYIRTVLGGSLTRISLEKGNRREVWRLTWYEHEALKFIEAILPFSRNKKPLLEFAQQFLHDILPYRNLRYDGHGGGRGGGKMTGIERSKRQKAFEVLKKLQTRGKPAGGIDQNRDNYSEKGDTTEVQRLL